MQRLFVSAGEPSGDAHAGAVLGELGSRGQVSVRAIGGDEMARRGAHIVRHTRDLSAIGFAEVVAAIPAHLRLLRQTAESFVREPPDAVMVVDYPGFHLRLAQVAHRAGLPVLYYIAPQMWAWGPGRVTRLRETVRHLAVILPFEERFFRDRGVPVTFVGHPLLDCPAPPRREVARRDTGLPLTAPVVALMPGSRATEIARMWPLMLATGLAIRHHSPEVRFVIGCVDGLQYPESERLDAAMAPGAAALAAADAALCKSGTVTLEAGLAGVPMVIAYRMHPLTHAIARRIVRCNLIGLVNLIVEREVAPEYVQDRASAEALAAGVMALLSNDDGRADRQREAFLEVRDRLGPPGAARRVSDLLLELAG